MDNSFRQHGSDTRQPSGFLANLQVFDDIINWLAGFIRLTEKEQEDAGIYIGNYLYK
jgi:hypothetical protein